ncbi:low temperature requirement protein LtrA [Salinibacterium sp. CAN_S4]|uniref:low temperature requirement protein A n=1 Tax=Salinibacterium sp. CAN_S4 TaxID=2787727 RepID=UPI0018EF7F63
MTTSSSKRQWGFRTNLLREDGEHADRVSFLELFFDLVFVFAVTELAHTLVYAIDKGQALEGILQTTVLLLAVWWVWVYTAWSTNWLDPDKTPVRWMLLILMLFGLLMSTSIPEAFGDRALVFVTAYVVMQIARSLFTALGLGRFTPETGLNVFRLTIWFAVSAIFWFAGALVDDLTLRLGLWGVAITIEYLGPVSGYRVPFLGRMVTSRLAIRGGHIAERAGLFMIIAIGESILVTGSAFAEHPIEPAGTLAFLSSLIGSIALWLLYFSRAESGGSRFIRRHDNPSQVAANSYTYLHVVLVAGIVLVAVADELVLAHPESPVSFTGLALIYGAPAVYLLGNLLFKRSIGAPWLRSHLLGIVTLMVFVLGATVVVPGLSFVVHSCVSTIVLIGVVIGEELDFRRNRTLQLAASGT